MQVKRWWLAAAGALAGCVVAVYAGSADNSFHYDDIHSLLENPHIRSLAHLPAFFLQPELLSSDPKNAMYRPLVPVSYAVNYAVGGYTVQGYHAVNLALHLGTSLLLLLLVWSLTSSRVGALTAALLFGLHPINSEVVNYISSRSESLCALFFLTAVLGFVRWRQPGGSGRRWYVLSLLATAGALAAKEVAVALPSVLLLYDGLSVGSARELRTRRTGLIRAHAPFWLLGLGYLLVVRGLLSTALGNPVRPWGTQVLTQVKAWVYYLKLLFVPHPLNVEHQFALSRSPVDPPVVAALLVLVSLLAMGWLVCRRSRREQLLWLGWPLLVLLPTSLVPLNVLVNEHRLYLPAACFAALLGSAAAGWLQQGRRANALLGVLWLTAYGLLSWQRSQVWQDEERLWQDSLARSPWMPRPHLYVGDQHQKAGRHEQALEEYAQALEVNPGLLSAGDRLSIHNNQGAAYLALGRNAEAMESYRRALAIDSTYARSRQALDALLAMRHQEWMPLAKDLHRQGLLALVGGRFDEAVGLLSRSLDIQVMPETYLGLGMACERQGDRGRALQVYEALVQIAPDSSYRRTATDRVNSLRLP
jgi:tetratricopeptide (TPR) repeat protein